MDISVKVFELYIDNSSLKIGIRVRGNYDSRVRKPMVTVIFDNGKENRRIPMPIQAYYPSEDLKTFDFFAGYSYNLNQVFFKDYGAEPITMSLEIVYGDDVFIKPIMNESSDLLVYGSEFYDVEFGKKHESIKVKPLVTDQEIGIKNIIFRIFRFSLSFLWNIVLIVTSIFLFPIFMVEAILNFIYCVKSAPRNNKTGIMRILFHIKWRISGIVRKNLSFGYLKLNLAKLGFNLFKLCKVKKNRIVFISNRRDNVSGNYEYIYDKLIDNKALDIRTVFDVNEGYLTCFKYGYYMATAKVLLVDDYIELIYKVPRREDNFLIQVWHACGAFKTFGFSRLGRPGGQKQKSTAHRNYDFCTVSSSEICKYYAEGFGLSMEKVIPTGVPRTDMFFSEEYKNKARDEFYGKYPALKEKKIILFAPTFRGNGKKSGFYPENRFDFVKLYEHFNGEYVIIIKHHPFVNNRVEIPYEYEGKIIDMSENEELNDLLFVTDVLITDYSSVVFEASLLDIPMLFYSFDLQNYISTRGFYYEYDSFVPGKIVFNMDALIESIENQDFESEKIYAFKHKFFDELDGKAGQRVANLILSLLDK
ncbi:MAG: CDP-glycerol glycerophosphotransferase family protein [Catonella sp.]|uniref:CDP-glycerol glycerophosphotransferase family protein n=1 Tax=Catonella sp. TaxID=2382125 RepID=UPI003FA14B4F